MRTKDTLTQPLKGEKHHAMVKALDLNEVDSRKRVMWDGQLNVTKGDKIEILRGIIMRDIYDSDIRATTIRNLTRDIKLRSRIEGTMMSESPIDFDPPMRGYAENIEVRSNNTTYFDIVEKGPSRNFIRLYDELIIHEGIRNVSEVHFKGGMYRSAVLDSFIKIESMVKQKIRGYENEDVHSLTTTRLMRRVFNLNNPILVWSGLETQAEKDEYEGYSHIFAGSMQGIRGPKAHQVFEQTPMRALRLLCLANLLAEIIDLSILMPNIHAQNGGGI